MADNVVNKSSDADGNSNEIEPATPKEDSASKGKNDGVIETSSFRTSTLSDIDAMATENTRRLHDTIKSPPENMDRRPSVARSFGPLPASPTEATSVLSQLEDLILYDDNNELVQQMVHLRSLESVEKNALASHSIAAFTSTLSPSHLRRLSVRIISDTGLWVSRLFRYFESSAYFHDDPMEGLVRICRMMLHFRYPKFSTEGYEALYPRPPIIYVSAAARSGLGQYLCTQLGLPSSSVSVVPCNTMFGSNFKMDIAALESLIQDDLAAQKVPLVIFAHAGTPVMGHVDNLYRLHEICRKHNIWLHVEGHSLSALCLVSTPNLPARIGDSMTLSLGTWLGVPAVPHVTLFRTMELAIMHAAGLTYNLHMRLNCLPLWMTLQMLGSDGVIQRIKTCYELSKHLQDRLASLPKIKILGKRPDDLEDVAKSGVTEILAKPVSTSLLLDFLSPTIVFQYVEEDKEAAKQVDGEPSLPRRNPPYFDNLNSWLGQILQRDVPKVLLHVVDVDSFGVCIRFCPIESAHAMGTTKEDVDELMEFFAQQVGILNATVKHKATFRALAQENNNLQVVEIKNWAGLGGLRYIPNHWLPNVTDLHDTGKEDINRLNKEVVSQLKNTDSAFSIGEGEDGVACVRFGMVTEETDITELINLVFNTGKEVEESSRYLESMAEIIKKGITAASEDLKKEENEKLTQEGLLRQVPLVGTFVNWWYPIAKESGIKGRTFNLHSGVIESTENIYRYHMQIQEGSPKSSPTTPKPSVQMPVRVSPQLSRSSSKSSVSSKQGVQQLNAENQPLVAVDGETKQE